MNLSDPQQDRIDVFLSYARVDRSDAERLYDAMQSVGLNVWWDFGVEAGAEFAREIAQAVELAAVTVVLWSEASKSSRWVLYEADHADKKCSLFPIRIADVGIPPPFGRLQTLDLFPPFSDDALNSVTQQIKSAVEGSLDLEAEPNLDSEASDDDTARFLAAKEILKAEAERGKKDVAGKDNSGPLDDEQFIVQLGEYLRPLGNLDHLAQLSHIQPLLEQAEVANKRPRLGTRLVFLAVSLVTFFAGLAAVLTYLGISFDRLPKIPVDLSTETSSLEAPTRAPINNSAIEQKSQSDDQTSSPSSEESAASQTSATAPQTATPSESNLKTESAEAFHAPNVALQMPTIHVPIDGYLGETVAFSDDGRFVAVADEDWAINVYFAKSGLLASRLVGHEGRIFSLKFSPNGDLLASGSNDRTARIWSIGQKKEIRRFDDGAGSVQSQFSTTLVDFSPDGEFLAYGGHRRSVTVVQVGLGTHVITFPTSTPISQKTANLEADRDALCGQSLSPSPECVAANKALRNLSAEEYAKSESAVAPVEAIAFSADGRFISTVSHGVDSDVQVFSWKTGTVAAWYDFRGTFDAMPRTLAFSPSSLELAILAEKSVGTSVKRKFVQLYVLDLASNEDPAMVLQSPYPVRPMLDYSPDGQFVSLLEKGGFAVFDTDARIVARRYNDGCYRFNVHLAGGSPLMIATDLCEGTRFSILPLSQLPEI